MRDKKIWSVANQKGGVGKTTTSITIGGILAQSGMKTLLIDLDPQASMTSYFGYDPENSARGVYPLFENHESALNLEQQIARTNFLNLHILTASTAMAALERRLIGRNGMGLVLQTTLGELRNRFDYIIIDCAPTMGILMLNAIAACDRLFIPVQTEPLAIKGLEHMVRSISMVNKARQKKIDFTILPTMFDQRTRSSRQVLEMLRAKYLEYLAPIVIPIDTQFRDACFAGTPLPFLNMQTRGVVAYQDLLRFIENSSNAKPIVENISNDAS